MVAKKQKQAGFTIVELLIVIVVIGVLAAISVVAYRGIQNRANDTSVQADIRQFTGKVREFQAIEGRYPDGGSATNVNGGFAAEGIGNFKFNRSAYNTTVNNNIYYCRGIVSGEEKFGIAALSNSGTVYASTSTSGGVIVLGLAWTTIANSGVVCPGLDVPLNASGFSYSYAKGSTGWFSWTQ